VDRWLRGPRPVSFLAAAVQRSGRKAARGGSGRPVASSPPSCPRLAGRRPPPAQPRPTG